MIDCVIYPNGWISPRTRKALSPCGCGVKCDSVRGAETWCRTHNLSVHAIEDEPAIADCNGKYEVEK